MLSYGDAISWSIRHEAVMRFVNRETRREAYLDKSTEGIALEMAITVEGRTVAAHMPLDYRDEPSKAVAKAVINCVEWFIQKRSGLIVGLN